MNARSLVGKIDELCAVAEIHKADVIGVTGTCPWANDNVGMPS